MPLHHLERDIGRLGLTCYCIQRYAEMSSDCRTLGIGNAISANKITQYLPYVSCHPALLSSSSVGRAIPRCFLLVSMYALGALEVSNFTRDRTDTRVGVFSEFCLSRHVKGHWGLDL